MREFKDQQFSVQAKDEVEEAREFQVSDETRRPKTDTRPRRRDARRDENRWRPARKEEMRELEDPGKKYWKTRASTHTRRRAGKRTPLQVTKTIEPNLNEKEQRADAAEA